MRRLCRVLFVVSIVALPVGATSQAPPPVPVFGLLDGTWRGTGTIMGREGAFSMRWQVDGGFAVLTFANAFINAVAVYRTDGSVPEAVWLDSRGVRIEIRWQATDSSLVAHWTAPTESGRTTYRVLSDGGIEAVDQVQSGDQWRIFATATYRRERSP